MNISLTNEKIFQTYIILEKLQTKKLPISICFSIMRNMKVMEDVAINFEKLRGDLFDKYAKKDGKGNVIYDELSNGQHAVKISNIPAFNEEYNELCSIEISLDLIGIKESAIMQLENNSNYDQLTAQELGALSLLFENENQEEIH